MKILTTSNLQSLVVALVIFTAVPVAFAWAPAPANPPKDNVEAPVNISKNDQNKTGKLGLGGLAVFGKFQLIDGTQGAGKVLVSDSNGKASWGAASGGVSSSKLNCQTRKGFVDDRWAYAECMSGEIRTGGGCMNKNAASSYHYGSMPITKGEFYGDFLDNYDTGKFTSKEDGWLCHAGSSGTTIEAYTVCCS